MFNWFKSKPAESQKPKTLGQIGEELAQEEYKKSGYEIIAANFFNQKGLRLGEVDFIAKNSRQIIFVEVKTRRSGTPKFGTGAEAVNMFKQQKILKAVKVFLLKNKEYLKLQPQIDVCEINYNQPGPVKSAEGGVASQQFDRVDKPLYSVTIIPNAVEDWN